MYKLGELNWKRWQIVDSGRVISVVTTYEHFRNFLRDCSSFSFLSSKNNSAGPRSEYECTFMAGPWVSFCILNRWAGGWRLHFRDLSSEGCGWKILLPKDWQTAVKKTRANSIFWGKLPFMRATKVCQNLHIINTLLAEFVKLCLNISPMWLRGHRYFISAYPIVYLVSFVYL